jgi:tetratricopeptide (TPR) repeat protein
LAQAENLSVPKITLTSKELLQKAYDRYHKSSDLNGTLELYKTIILSDPNSSEADSAKAQVKKILASNELFEKAYNRHYKANDITNALDYYKMVIEIFPDSPDACYAKTQIKNIEALESKVLDPLRGILSIQV